MNLIIRDQSLQARISDKGMAHLVERNLNTLENLMMINLEMDLVNFKFSKQMIIVLNQFGATKANGKMDNLIRMEH